ncbi:MAG: NADP oxidoreductase [Anaerolineae bacterium]|nr:NADP oxidoreductase [Anaerolineae bacterium]
MSKVRMATVWLDGCSGCHMSFLDIDDRLLALADKIDLVYSPLVDHKEFPPDVDLTLVEGAVSSEEDLKKILMIRQRTNLLIALGDCAVNGNVPSMRNAVGAQAVLERAYLEEGLLDPGIPQLGVPSLLPTVLPVHVVVPVDLFVPGCPPPADTIFYVITQLLEGQEPDVSSMTRFGK